ncbi:unnamed protein product, partial [Laminaria digitata]
GGRAGGGNIASRQPASSSSWADECWEGSTGTAAAAVAVAVADPWAVRVARIRRQAEFCVERGWIARGNRQGTYTLPKPPPRYGSPRQEG